MLFRSGALIRGWDHFLEIRIHDTGAFVELVRLNADTLEKEETGAQLAFFGADSIAQVLFGIKSTHSGSEAPGAGAPDSNSPLLLDGGLSESRRKAQASPPGGSLPREVKQEFVRLVPYARWGLPAAAFTLTSLVAPLLFPEDASFFWLLSAPAWLGVVFWLGAKGASYALTSWVSRRMRPLFNLDQHEEERIRERRTEKTAAKEVREIQPEPRDLLGEAGFLHRTASLFWGEPGETIDNVGRLFAALGGEPLIRGTLVAGGLPQFQAHVLARLVLLDLRWVRKRLAVDEQSDATRDVLVEAFATDDLEIKAHVVDLLKGSQREKLRPLLMGLLKDGREAEQVMAARALTEMMDPDLAQELEGVYEAASRRVRVELDRAIMAAWDEEDTDPG